MLVDKEGTLEKDIHVVIEQNMWIFGYDYNMMASNITTSSIIEKYFNKKFSGGRAKKRPDLLLNKGYKNSYLLVEFKRPIITIERDHERQAIEYRDDLKGYIHNGDIDIIVLGGKVNPIISNDVKNLKSMSFDELIAEARTQLEWLLDELKRT